MLQSLDWLTNPRQLGLRSAGRLLLRLFAAIGVCHSKADAKNVSSSARIGRVPDFRREMLRIAILKARVSMDVPAEVRCLAGCYIGTTGLIRADMDRLTVRCRPQHWHQSTSLANVHLPRWTLVLGTPRLHRKFSQ